MKRQCLPWKALLTAIVATAPMACASTSTMQSSLAPDRAESSSSDVITTAELRRLDPGLSVMDVVEHARPWFLHRRGSTSTVSVDNGPPTESSVLRAISIAQVKEVRLLCAAGESGPVAIRPDGAVVVGDVILVVTGR